MKIAVLSDIHDHMSKLRIVIKQIENNVGAMIFCGDMVSPYTTKLLSEVGLPVYLVVGNNDEDQIGMYKAGGVKFNWTHLSQEFGETGIDSRKIAFMHYPKLAELLAKEGKYDAVFFGHTHIVHNEKIGETLLLNPGAVCGINFDKSAYDTASFAIYDTKTNSAEIIKI